MMSRPSCLLAALAACLLNAGPGAAQHVRPTSPADAQFFESKVRPVLAENCYKCHGAAKQKGELRLDSRAAALSGGEQGPAVVPGDPAKSLLVKAILHDDPELKMPPSKKLPKEQIALLTEWVQRGAPWPGSENAGPAAAKKGEFQITDKDRAHWAFQPIQRPTLPAVKDAAWVAHPLDRFILAGLEAKGLTPNPPAGKNELVRRLFYDLTGLPPSPQDVEAFVKDADPEAYGKLIDRLLDSPRYGEKWGRHWLDLVHYAETNSYERDNPKPNVWRYRDYVIRSFNQDKPFDEFTREQIAGDELGRNDADALIATGYYRLGIWDDEPSDPLQARYDTLDDIVATTGQVFLGLTLDCARCHNHKIDPIAQKDYYRFLAFFHNINHYRNGGPTDERVIYSDSEGKARVDAELRALEKQKRGLQTRVAGIEKEFREKAEKYAPKVGGDLADLRYRLYRGAWQQFPDFTKLSPVSSGTLPKNLFDLSRRGGNEGFGFVFEGTLNVPADGRYTFTLDSDDGSRLSLGEKTLLVYDGIHGTGTPKQVSVDLKAGPQPIRLDYFQNTFGLGLRVTWAGPNFGPRLLSSAEAEAFAPFDFVQHLKLKGAEVLGKDHYEVYLALKRELDLLKVRQLSAVETALCVTETGSRPGETHVLLRGNPAARGETVEPGAPQVLPFTTLPAIAPTADGKSSGRRKALADWLVARENPLTARVLANRVWQYHFGRGIVRSPNDYGLQGNRPTHPELLDWLATELTAGGWKLKPLHKQILLSQTYRMSSRGNDKALAVDPANDHFWRFDMRRLSAEEVRDSILAVSGGLNLKMFGPGVMPEIPKDVLAGQSVPGRGWAQSKPDEASRRSVYVHVKRSLILPILESFDVAETDRTTPVRFATTQPTQALGMLNGDFLHQQAARFAERLRREAGDDPATQVRFALSLATQRSPRDAEVERGLRLVRDLQREGSTPAAALVTFCLLALNLNEFMYLD